ncbi:MAG: hypothetical protein VX730_04615 [Pseudomonadota bacterium]|nr:hypothetical protein [Pseudomonadota bacterium]
MALRAETSADRANVATLIARTYGTAAAEIIEKTGILRDDETFGEPYGYVWEEEGTLKAYTLCSPVVEGGSVVFMAPLAFDLLDESFDFSVFLPAVFDGAEKRGVEAIVIAGDAEQNAEAGFKRATDIGMTSNKSIPGGELLVKPLVDGFVGKVDIKLPEAL